jgi:serine/threonine-protein kinase RsbW
MGAEAPLSPPSWRRHRVSLTAAPEDRGVARLLARAERFAAEAELPSRVRQMLLVTVDEWAANLVRHACPVVGVCRAELGLGWQDGRLKLRLRDDGPAFDPTHRDRPVLPSSLAERALGGDGWHLIRTFAIALEWRRQRGCNVLELVLPGE